MDRSAFLFPTPRWHEGVGRIVDVGGAWPLALEWSESPMAADIRAMFEDWAAVGDDLREALRAALAEMDDDQRAALTRRLRQLTNAR